MDIAPLKCERDHFDYTELRNPMMLTTVFVMQLLLIVLLIVGVIVIRRKLTEKRVTTGYEPFVYKDKKLFREKVVAGYRIHYYYDGIPFGEPSERIVYQSNEVDKEAIETAITEALPIVTKSMVAAIGVSPIKLSDIQKAINKVLD